TVFTPPVRVREEEEPRPQKESFFGRMKAAVFGASTDEARKDEEMNVASTFGGDEATTAAEPTSRDEVPYQRADRDEESNREERYERPDRYESRDKKREDERRPASSAMTPPSQGFAPGAGL